MERFPTWKIWLLLHTYPARDIHLWLRVLRVKSHGEPSAGLDNAWTWVVANLMVSVAAYFILPVYRISLEVFLWINWLIFSLLITVDSLRFALKATASISKWHELGNYDLFALLPAGALTSTLHICRTHRAYLEDTIRGVKSLLIFIFILSISCILALANPDIESYEAGFGAIFAMLALALVLMGLMRCVDYVQAFVSATLIALLASQRRNHGEAQARLILGFLGLQIALYFGLLPFLISLPFIGRENWFSPYRSIDLYFWSLVLFAPLIFVLCRELINFALWQAVKRRLEA